MTPPWCPTCACRTDPGPDGACLFCDTPTEHRRGGGKPAGRYGYITDAQVRACHVLYEQGLSLNDIARQIVGRTRYASARSCALSLREHFCRLGLPRRDRIEAVVLACTRHGMASKHGPRPGYSTYKRRVLRDQEDQPRCAGVRTQYPRKGQPCQRPAMYGSVYCQAHDPAREEARRAHLRAMRARMGRAA